MEVVCNLTFPLGYDQIICGDGESAIVLDQDRKLLSKLWTAVLERLYFDLLDSTAHDPRTCGRAAW